ncbi:hypothetical protein LTR10_015479 [Elasticomyces elasticus]|uniref:FAD/NAD(P)-binding domain-containing protein n=1 Tax=Exophiala sideris TaxID=1016849 RepID=A0ABR0J5C0_9EURO|nr:hypothetical protein LTR10_015479 [Elasticomyces elasticus]KAK5026929.1 hypothetical protein LTS07_007228 [Exophiala sideris]KAK5033933.1 hypothetical protein LTR13_006533 [Exophiala sideris]KAK5055792.1 hypothetical protein LTR69_008167 [Exophiala sideris]KAK5180875.1 hypothetical protein LTR44_006695 [Eurotiomycetes sp. CCFEE 6388]
MGDAGPQKVKRSILERLPGAFPIATVPKSVDVDAVSSTLIEALPSLSHDVLLDDAIWRDSFGLTGTMRTFYTKEHVIQNWAKLVQGHGAADFSLIKGSTRVVEISSSTAWIEAAFRFTTTESPATLCSGFLSIVSTGEAGTWKIWLIRTILENLTDHGDVDHLEPIAQQTQTGSSRLGQEPIYFDVVVVGGGQSGLATGGRLQALGVSHVVLDKNTQVGDAWGNRYESARLHTVREYSHLPFERTFGPEYDEYLGKDALSKGHREWAQKYGINIWQSTTLEQGPWDEASNTYILAINRDGIMSTISTKHVVFATGAGSQNPRMPQLPDKEMFHGTILHSADYRSAEGRQGEAGIVVGSANTGQSESITQLLASMLNKLGHDIADDMYEAGMSSVTMVQRSRTFVLPVEYIADRYHALYNARRPTELSDRMQFSGPTSINRLMAAHAFHAMARAEPERWEALERAGFRVDPYGDIQEAINIRLGGHYIDVGTSAKISKGLIKMKSGPIPIKYTETGLLFDDGSKVRADVIVWATGFNGNLRHDVEKIMGNTIAAKCEDCFGLNEEGEVLGAYKPMAQKGIWYLGGAIGHARYYSRFIALSIKADTTGQPLPVYLENQATLPE